MPHTCLQTLSVVCPRPTSNDDVLLVVCSINSGGCNTCGWQIHFPQQFSGLFVKARNFSSLVAAMNSKPPAAADFSPMRSDCPVFPIKDKNKPLFGNLYHHINILSILFDTRQNRMTCKVPISKIVAHRLVMPQQRPCTRV